MQELAIRILDPAEGQFLRKIEWNREEFEGWMQELSVRYADAAIITPDDLKASKADRAELNKIKKAINDRRIEVKKAVMEPYEAFEKELSDATASIDEIAEAIDRTIKNYETAEKQEKKERIRKLFESEVKKPFYAEIDPSELEFLTFERVFDPKWLNASCRMTRAEKELNEKLNKIEEDLHSILTMETEPAYRAGALKEYKRTLDLGAALKLHADLAAMAQKEKEEQRRREEEAAEKRRREEMEKLRQKLSSEPVQQSTALQGQAEPREASVRGFQQQGQGNPQAPVQNATQRQDGGKFGYPGGADNANRYANPHYGPYEGAPATGPVVPTASPIQPPPVQKTYFVEFRVEGSRDQLMALKDYMDRNGLRYGKVQKG